MATYGRFQRLFFLWIYAVFLCQYSSVSDAVRDHFDAKRRLVEYLTNNSDTVKEILPARDINTPVNVKLRIKLRQIATLDEKNQAMRLTVWLSFYWNNPFLMWKPADYEGIQSVHASHELFWVPDVALFNEASLEEEIEILYKRLATKLIINKNGDCEWHAPATLLSQCKIDVSRFPFDEQNCDVVIGSWTYSGNKINVTYFEREADLSNFIENGEWIVQSALLENNFRLYGPEKIPYPDVTLTLKIQRRPLYYGLNIVIPCALIAVLALFSFILPSDHGERMSLVITVLLAVSVYMLILSSSLPETSDTIPDLGIYCLGIIVTIALCLCATCLTLKFRDMKSPMPEWMDVLIIRYLGRFVFVKFENDTLRSSSNDKISVSLNNEKLTKIEDDEKFPNLQDTEEIPLVNANGISTKDLNDALLDEIRLLTEELRSRQEDEVFAKKWKKAAKVVDRISFVLFSFIYICLIVYLLSSM